MAQLKVTQVKSKIGGTASQRNTLRSLGLHRIGDTVVKEWLEKAGTDGQAVLKAFNDSK